MPKKAYAGVMDYRKRWIFNYGKLLK